MIHLPSNLKGSYLVIPSAGQVWKYAGTTGQSRWLPMNQAAARGGVLEDYQGQTSGLTGLFTVALIIGLIAKG